MPRSPITGKDIDVITDDGSVLFSVRQGEQFPINITATSLTNLTGYTIVCKVTEGANAPGDGETVPTSEDATLTVTTLPIIDDDVSDNMFKVVLPKDLADAWDVQPTPDDPIYGFIALEIIDTGVGDEQQIRVPMAGLVEIRYNPVRST